MRKRIRMALRASSLVMVFTGYWALTTSPIYETSILVVPVLMMLFAPIGEWCDRHLSFYRLLSQGVLLLCLASIPAALVALGLLNAVITLVIFVQAYTMVHEKKPAHYYYLYLMSFFLLLTACMHDPSAQISLVLAVFLLSTVWALLSLRLWMETGQTEDFESAEITALTSARSSLDASRPRVYTPGFLLSVSAVSLAAMALTIAAFLLTPRVEAGFLSRSEERFRTGIEERIELENAGLWEHDYRPVMTVSFPKEADGIYDNEDGLYWRAFTMPQYEHGVWSRGMLLRHHAPGVEDLHPHNLEARGEVFDSISRTPQPAGRQVKQRIYLDLISEGGLPALDLVRQMTVVDPRGEASLVWDRAADFSVQALAPNLRHIAYEAVSEVRDWTPEELRASSLDYAGTLQSSDYRMLTHQDLLPETQALARSLTDSASTAYDKVAALSAWFNGENFVYTFNLPSIEEKANAIDGFILRTRVGNCQYFASGLALMLRSLGIPTRMVVGYHGGEWDRGMSAYLVRNNMAHAWVEVFFPDYGWVRFDPSPATRPEGLNQSWFAGLYRNYSMRAKMFWLTEVMRFDRQRQSMRLRQMLSSAFSAVHLPALDEGVLNAPRGLRAMASLLPALALIAAIAFLALRRFRRRKAGARWRPELTPNQQRATKVFRRLCRRLKRHGIVTAGRTSAELREELESREWRGLDAAREVLGAYDEARFGAYPLPPERCAELLRRLRTISPKA